MRFGIGAQGKRGGVRVIWYVLNDELPLIALLIYGKNEQANPTPAQRQAMVALVDTIKRAASRRTEGENG